MAQHNPASINSLPDEVLEKILLQLRAPQNPQFWLLRGVNQRWLSLVRRYSNFRAEIQSHNLRTIERDGETAYLFHLVETKDAWKTESDFLSASCLENSTFFGQISECNVQIVREHAFDIASAVVNSAGILTERLCLQDKDIPLSLEVALNHSQHDGISEEASISDQWVLSLPTMDAKKFSIRSLQFYAILSKPEFVSWGESLAVTETIHFFQWLASAGALKPLTSLSISALDGDVEAKKVFDLAPNAILQSGYWFLKPTQRTRFFNMLPDIFRSDTLKTLSTWTQRLEEVPELIGRFRSLEELTLYGRAWKEDAVDFSALKGFASLRALALYVTVAPRFPRKRLGGGCCDGNGMKKLPSVALPAITSLTVCAPDVCIHAVTKMLTLAPAASELTLTDMSNEMASEALKVILSKQRLPSLQRLALNLGRSSERIASNEVEDLVQLLAAKADRLPAVQHLRIAVNSWSASVAYARRDYSLFEDLPANIKSVELGNVFSPAVQKPFQITPGCAMEWLCDLIDHVLRTRLDSAVVSLHRIATVQKSHFAEFISRLADQPDQFGKVKFQNKWRYLGEAKWEVMRDLGEPSALVTLLKFDNEVRLLKFRLVSGDDAKITKLLDLYIAPKTMLPN